MRKEIIINGQSLPVREYEGRRVVTIMDVARAHKTPKKTITRNFERNKKRFIEGMDYLHLKGKRATTKCGIASKMTTEINIFTESGYLMLVKSLTDDLAWKVQRELVNGYFRTLRPSDTSLVKGGRKDKACHSKRDKACLVSTMFPLMREEYKTLLHYRMINRLTQEETAVLMKIGKGVVEKMEKSLRNAGIKIPKAPVKSKKYIQRDVRTMIDYGEV